MESTIIPIGGMVRNVAPELQPENTVRKVVNGVIEGNKLKNELGFELENTDLQSGDVPCGIVTDGITKVIFVKNGNTNRIYKVENKIRTTIAQGNFNFNERFIITGSVIINRENERICVFIQNDQPFRWVNLDDFDLTMPVKLYSLVPNVVIPELSVTELEYGGSIESGAYYPYISYNANYGQRFSKWLPIGKPIFAVSSKSSLPTFYKGDFPSKACDKQFQLQFSGLDADYNSIIIAFVKRSNNTLEAFVAGEIPIQGNTADFIYSGQSIEVLDLETVLSDDSGYYGGEAVANANKETYIGNVKKRVVPGFQEEAFKIKIKGVSKFVTVPANDSSKFKGNNEFTTFKHGEVYNFFACPVFEDGSEGELYHIPGDSLGFTGNFEDGCKISLTEPTQTVAGRFRVYQPPNPADPFYDDATLGNDVRYFQTRDTYKNPTLVLPDTVEYDLGVWENKNFVYSPDYGTLAGQPMRFHKFPSLSAALDMYLNFSLGAADKFGVTTMDCLGIEVDTSLVNQTILIQNKVVGLKIYYSKRDTSNITQLGVSPLMYNSYRNQATPVNEVGNVMPIAGLLCNSGETSKDQGTTVSSWPNNELGIRFHAFDMLKNVPPVTPSYIRNEYRLRNPSSPIFVKDRPPGGGDVNIVGEADFSNANAVTDVVAIANTIKKIKSGGYFPNNSVQSPVINKFGEAAFNYIIENIATISDFLNSALTMPASSSGGSTGLRDLYTYLASAVVYRENVFSNFEAGFSYVACSKIIPIGSTGIGMYMFDGDCFISLYSFYCYGRLGSDLSDTNPTDARTGLYKAYVEGYLNPAFRDMGSSKYEKIPFTDPQLTIDPDEITFDRQIDPNQAPYSTDYSSKNDLQLKICYRFRDINEFPLRILRFSRSLGFRIRDFYDIDGRHGKVYGLVNQDSRLLIITEKSTLITIGQETFTSDNGNTIVTGNEDIFRAVPREIKPDKDGIQGTQHKLSICQTPFGVINIDEQKRTINLVSQEGLNISSIGLTDDFADILSFLYKRNGVGLITDNPLYRYGVGYTVAYDPDPKYKRVIIHKKDYKLKFGINNVLWSPNGINANTLTIGQYYIQNGVVYKVLTQEELNSGKYDFNTFTSAQQGDAIAAAIEFTNEDEYEYTGFTYSFYFERKAWVSEHSYRPILLANTRDNLYSVTNQFNNFSIWRHNAPNVRRGLFYNTPYNFEICVAFGGSPKIFKNFFNINWATNALANNALVKNYTFNTLFAYHQFNATELIVLQPPFGSPLANNIALQKNRWNFSKLRNAVIDQEQAFVINENIPILSNLGARTIRYRDRVVSNYLVVCLAFNNNLYNSIPVDLEVIDISTKFNAPVML